VAEDWENGRTSLLYREHKAVQKFKSFKTFNMFEELTTECAEKIDDIDS